MVSLRQTVERLSVASVYGFAVQKLQLWGWGSGIQKTIMQVFTC